MKRIIKAVHLINHKKNEMKNNNGTLGMTHTIMFTGNFITMRRE